MNLSIKLEKQVIILKRLNLKTNQSNNVLKTLKLSTTQFREKMKEFYLTSKNQNNHASIQTIKKMPKFKTSKGNFNLWKTISKMPMTKFQFLIIISSKAANDKSI